MTQSRQQARLGDRHAKRHQEIVDASAVIFAQKGYDATSLEDLIEATSLKRGGLYHYIGSKNDLLVAIHDRVMKPLLEQVRTASSETSDPEEALRRYAAVLLGNIGDYFPHVTVILREWRAMKQHPDWPRLHAERRYVEDRITAAIEDGQSAGRFRKTDARLAALGLIGMVNYSYEWLRLPGPSSPEEIAAKFVDIFLHGICDGGDPHE